MNSRIRISILQSFVINWMLLRTLILKSLCMSINSFKIKWILFTKRTFLSLGALENCFILETKAERQWMFIKINFSYFLSVSKQIIIQISKVECEYVYASVYFYPSPTNPQLTQNDKGFLDSEIKYWFSTFFCSII